jgi:O-glycosyl hydrolase
MIKTAFAVLLLFLLFVIVSCKKNTLDSSTSENSTVRSEKLTSTGDTSGGSINIDIGFPQQKVDMVGAGCYFYSGHLVNGITNPDTAANWLWKNLNVNVFKIVLWAGGVEDVNDNSDPNVTDFTKFNFTSNSNLVTQITAAKKALSINPNIKIWAIVLSPPKFLKTNNNVNYGGTLNTAVANAYAEFGEFIYAHLKNLQNNGITVSYLSMMNEPDDTADALNINYDSADFTPVQADSVYKYTGSWLKGKLPGYGITVPQFASPDCISVTDVGNYTSSLNDSGNINFFTTHQYENSSAANFATASAAAGSKGLYMTEFHAGFGMGNTPDSLVAALDLINKFHDAFRGGAKGWLYFEWGAPTSNFGGLLYTPWGAPAQRFKNYYAYQQFTANLLGESYIATHVNNITKFGSDNVSAFTVSNHADINIVNWNTYAQNRVQLNFGGNIKTINIYRTSASENNKLIWSATNVNLNYYLVDFPGKSFTTVRITW